VLPPPRNLQGFSAAEKATGISFATLQSQKSLLQQIVYYHIVKQVGGTLLR
jgi:hypothetical protein